MERIGGVGCEEPLLEFLAAHLQGEERGGDIVADRGVAGEVSGEDGFPHGRAGSDEDELSGLQAAGEGVEVGEPGLEAFFGTVLADVDDFGDGGHDVRADGEVVVAAVGEASEAFEGVVGVLDDLVGGAGGAVDAVGHAVGGFEDFPQDGFLVDDEGVPLAVGGGGYGAGEFEGEGGAAAAGEVAVLFEAVGEGDGVVDLALGVEVEECPVDRFVLWTVEVSGLEDLDDLFDGAGRQEHRAEDGPLGFEVERRLPVRLAVVVGGVAVVGHEAFLKSAPVNLTKVEPPSAKRDVVRAPSGSRVGRLVEISVGSWFCHRWSMSWAMASTVQG